MKMIWCLKFDDVDYVDTLMDTIANNNIISVICVKMELSYCGGIKHAVLKALQYSKNLFCGRL